MKKAYIGVMLLVSVAMGFTLWAFTNGMSPFVDIQTARKSQSVVQIRGIIVKDAGHSPFYDPSARALKFWIQDDKKELCQVVYHGAKPDSFDIANGLAASGIMSRDASGQEFFNSDSLSLKCPSKYDDYKVDYNKKPSAGGAI